VQAGFGQFLWLTSLGGLSRPVRSNTPVAARYRAIGPKTKHTYVRARNLVAQESSSGGSQLCVQEHTPTLNKAGSNGVQARSHRNQADSMAGGEYSGSAAAPSPLLVTSVPPNVTHWLQHALDVLQDCVSGRLGLDTH
jgi:hypothetical protein